MPVLVESESGSIGLWPVHTLKMTFSHRRDADAPRTLTAPTYADGNGRMSDKSAS